MFSFAHFFGTNEVQLHHDNEDIDDMIQKDVDDDWILIDVESHHHIDNGKNDEESEEMNELFINESSNTFSVPHTAAQCQSQCDNCSDNCSDISKSPIPVQVMMEESWFVTPPPCFINHSNNAISIETTPFENLLIEHPSMSVFGPSLPRTYSMSSLPSSASSSETPSSQSSNTSSNSIAVTANQLNNTVHSRRQQRNNNIQRRANNNNINQNTANISSARAVIFNEWRSVLSSMQKSEAAQYEKFITKAHLDRQNKVAFQRNRPPNRGMKMFMKPNGVCNNRKNC